LCGQDFGQGLRMKWCQNIERYGVQYYAHLPERAQPRPPRRKTFDAPVSSVFPQGRNSVEARTASDVLPSDVFVSVAFEVSAPRGVPLALFIVGYVQTVRSVERPATMRTFASRWPRPVAPQAMSAGIEWSTVATRRSSA
jgi:hypothetical protein